MQTRQKIGSIQHSHIHGVQTNRHKIDYSRYVDWKHNIYKHMQGTKPKHAKEGQVTYNVNKLSKSYRKKAHWI